MPKKILISSLGTGQKKEGSYRSAKYTIDKKIYETSFIADALNRHFDIDEIFLIGTKKSIWDEAYLVFDGLDDNYYEELYEKKEHGLITRESLEKLENIKDTKIKPFLIEYGVDEEELWSNFEVFLNMAKYIDDGDTLYLDITHSFRSLSLMSFVMTQFASSISDKNFTIKGVFYGMIEYSSENKGLTPIVDIKLFLEISEWIKAIDAIKKYSDFDPLVELLRKEGIEKDVYNTFSHLNNTIQIANMAAMQQFIKTASKKINKIKNSSNKIIKLLTPEVLDLVEELNYDEKSKFQFALAKWFYKNKNHALSYMALAESVITKTCEIKYPKENSDDESIRNQAKKCIDYPYNEHFNKTINGKPNPKTNILDIRNNIAHQVVNRKDKVNQDIDKLKEFIERFEKYIFN